jgi:hypothetical protein
VVATLALAAMRLDRSVRDIAVSDRWRLTRSTRVMDNEIVLREEGSVRPLVDCHHSHGRIVMS